MNDIERGACFITESVKSKKPFFVGKIGTSELDILIFYIQHRQPPAVRPYPQSYVINITRNAGLFPATDVAIDNWASYMIQNVLPNGDGFAAWNPSPELAAFETALIKKLSPKAALFPLRSLEPYYVDDVENRWTYMIPSNTKVAVVSPFLNSIENQWKKHGEIWKNNPIWGSNPPEIIPIRSGYSPSLSSTNGKWSEEVINQGWQAAVNQIVNEVKEVEARFAIVGCGALSLPVCYKLKEEGIASVHTGGATQILFGIKGRRWLNHGTISNFFNSSWEFPVKEEIPSKAREIEGGCYW